MSDVFLTAPELRQLTGRVHKSAQVEWLRRHRWRYAVTSDGEPRVAREYWRARMVADQDAPDPWAPDLASLERRA